MKSCTTCPSYNVEVSPLCYLKLQQDGKVNQLLKQCFEHHHPLGSTAMVLGPLYLKGADLSDLDCRLTNFQDTDFTNANLQRAFLNRVRLESCLLDNVNFEGAILEQVDFRRVSSMRDSRWFYVITIDVLLPAVTRLGKRCIYETKRDWGKAEYVYRHWKELYKNQGQYSVSGLFFEQEMEMQRRQSRGREWLALTGLWLTCGYGERPIRAIMFAMGVIFIYAAAYYFLPLTGANGLIQYDFGAALYFSVITFTTLGYGDIRPEGFARLLAATEALTGAFTVALFVFVFCRRMTR